MTTVPGRDVLNEIRAFTEHAKDEFAFTIEKQEEQKIKTALRRYGGIDTALIDVVIYDDTIVMNGVVKSRTQKEDAENIVFIAIPGVTKVENNLNVHIEHSEAEVPEF